MSGTSVSMEIVGKPVDGKLVEVEDFWMARIRNIENQYDEHVRTLERKLLDQRRNARLVASLQQHNTRLQGQVTECTETAQAFARKLEHLRSDLKETQRKKKQSEFKMLESKQIASTAKKELHQTIEENRYAVRQRDMLNQRLADTENAKKKLDASLRGVESDMARVREDMTASQKETMALTRALMQVKAEKETLATVNQRTNQTVTNFVKEREDEEDRLYKMKLELEQVLDQLGKERLASLDIFRDQKLGQKQLREAKQDLANARSKMDANSFETLYWKKEAAMLKTVARFSSGVKADHGRGRVAHLRERVRDLEQKMDVMEKDRRKTNAEVKSLKALHDSLTRLQHQNQTTRRRLQPKLESNGRVMDRTRNQENATSALQVQLLQKKVEGLEKELNHFKNKHSVLKMELNGKLGLERELRWTEKALLQAEADKIQISESAAASARQLGGSSKLLKQKLMTQIGAIHKIRDSVQKPKENIDNQIGKLVIPSFRTKAQLDEDALRVRTELALAERRQAVFQAMQEAAEAKKAAAAQLEEDEEAEEEGPEFWLDVETEEAMTSEADLLSSSSSSSSLTSSAKERKKMADKNGEVPEVEPGQDGHINKVTDDRSDEEIDLPLDVKTESKVEVATVEKVVV